jgi:glutaminyl-tRNA synthetase
VHLKDSWQKQVAAPAPPASKKAPPAAPAQKHAEKVIELSPEAIALRDAHGISADAARTITLEPVLGPLFAAAVSVDAASAKTVATLLANDVLGELRAKKLTTVPFDGAALVELAGLVKDGTISSAQTKEVLAAMFAAGGKSPKAVVAEKGLAQIANADALIPIVDQVLAENVDTVGRYKAGNANVFGALVGMVMKKSGGRANAKLVKELLEQKLA